MQIGKEGIKRSVFAGDNNVERPKALQTPRTNM